MNQLNRSLLRAVGVSNRHLISKRFEGTVNTKLDQVDDKPLFPGSKSDFSTKLEFSRPEVQPGIPVYRYLNLYIIYLENNISKIIFH